MGRKGRGAMGGAIREYLKILSGLMTANSQSDSRNGFLAGSPFYILFLLHSALLKVSPNPQTYALVLPQQYLPLEQSLPPVTMRLNSWAGVAFGQTCDPETQPGAGRDPIYQLPQRACLSSLSS